MLAKVALNDGVNAVALAMAREACAAVLMFIIARRYDTCFILGHYVPAVLFNTKFTWLGFGKMITVR